MEALQRPGRTWNDRGKSIGGCIQRAVLGTFEEWVCHGRWLFPYTKGRIDPEVPFGG